MAIALMKMFWKSMYMPSKINTILEKEDVTLEELIAEDDVVEECKSCNSKLIDFLTKEENLERLVDMMVDEPDPDAEEKSKYKNAHIACEILTSDMTQITDALSERVNLLEKIYSFFDRDPSLNPLQASFFSKTMGLLITHKSEKMLTFLKSHADFTKRLVSHLDVSAIADLLLRLVTCIDNVECRNHCFQWLNEQRLVQHLVSLIDISQSSEVHSNASQSICDIIRLSREHQYQHVQQQHVGVAIDNDSNDVFTPDDILLQAIECTETVDELLNRALPRDLNLTSESLITNTITTLQTLLEPKKTSTTIFSIIEDTLLSSAEGEESSKSEENKENYKNGGSCSNNNNNISNNCNNENNKHVEHIIASILSRLQDFFNILSDPPKQRYNPMPSTLGLLDPPLGPSRLAVVRFFNVLLSLKDASIEEKMRQINVPSKLLSLFFEYPWNSFLHGEVEKFIFHILNSNSTPNLLLSQLLQECNLVEKVYQELEQYFKLKEESEELTTAMKPRRPGYLGHLISIANLLVNKFNNSPELRQELSEEMQSNWAQFVSGVLEDINKVNSTDLGVGINSGRGLLTSSDDDDDDDDCQSLLIPQDDCLQKAFNNYQQQDLNTNFVEGFGFTENDFNEPDDAIGSPFKDRISSLDFNLDCVEDNPMAAATFQQACQDRIQQFDQSDAVGEEHWPPLSQQMSKFNQLASNLNVDDRSNYYSSSAQHKSRASSSSSLVINKSRSNSQVMSDVGVKGHLNGDEDEDGDDEEYEDDGMKVNRNDEDSDEDLDSPQVIFQTRGGGRVGDGPSHSKTKGKQRVSMGISNSGANFISGDSNSINIEDDDGDYESLKDNDIDTSLDVSFVANYDNDDDDDDGNEGVKDNEEVKQEEDSSLKLNGAIETPRYVDAGDSQIQRKGSPVEETDIALGNGDGPSLLDQVASKFGLLSISKESIPTSLVVNSNNIGSAVDLEDS